MKRFVTYASFSPTIRVTCIVDPFEGVSGSQSGYLLLENGDYLLQEDGFKIFLEATAIFITADTEIYTADNANIRADATFVLNVN